jgi:hypothetical protein
MKAISDGDSNPKSNYHRLYSIWSGVKRRCLSKSCRDFGWYGARGISICTEWKGSYKIFKEWSIANGYDKKKTLDRINTLGNYEPGNCRWASHKTQNNNRSTNVRIDYEGASYTLAELAEKLKISKATIKDRKRRKGLVISELVKKVVKEKMIKLKDGTKITRKEGAKILGIPYRTMISRYAKYGNNYRKLGWGD